MGGEHLFVLPPHGLTGGKGLFHIQQTLVAAAPEPQGDIVLCLHELAVHQHIQQAQQLVRELLARYRSSGISMALGVVVCQTPIANIDEVLSQADREMYTDKERIYTSWRHS